MLNQVILIGRIVSELSKKDENWTIITIAILRNYKNGEYEKDFIDVTIREPLANTVKKYCKKDNIIGIKGTLQSEFLNAINSRVIKIVAEKITFLSSKNCD